MFLDPLAAKTLLQSEVNITLIPLGIQRKASSFSRSAVGNADACEVNSASSQKTSHGREESMFKSQPEGDDMGSLHVKKSMHMSVEKERNEENQELDPAAAGEDENMVEEEVEVLIEKSDVHEDSSGTEKVGDEAEKLDEEPEQILITPLSEVKSDHNVDSDTVAEKDSNEKTSVSAELDGVKSDHKFDDDQIEDNQDLSPATPSDLNVRHIVDSVTVAGNDSNEKTNLGAENLPAEEPDQFQATCPPSEAKSDLDIHDMIDSDACEVKSASTQKTGRGEESQMKSPPSEGGNVFEQFGNYMMMGEFEMSSEYTDVHQRSITENMNLLYVSPMEYSDYSVDQVHKSNDNNCVISSGGNATTCLDTSSGAKDPSSEVETSDLDAHEMVFAGTATTNAYISGAKFESSQKMSISPASGEIIGSSTKLLINSVTPTNIGFCDVEGSSQIGVNMEQVDNVQMEASETVADHLLDGEPHQFLTTPPSEVKSDHKVDSESSEDENMVGREVEVLSEKTNVQEDTSETKKDEAEKIDQISNHQGKTMENVNDEGSSPRLVEHIPDLDYNNCVQAEAAAMCFDASTCAKNTYENTDVPVEDNLDEVCSSSFEDSDGTPLQVLPTDPTNEVETSDLGHHEMVVTGTATTNADTSGVKFECSQKVNVSPVSEKVIGSSTKLTNNTVMPKEIGFIYVEKNMQIGVDEEQVYHSEVKKNDNNTNVTVENIQIGFFGVEENMQVGGNEEQVYHSEVKKNDDNTNVTVENRKIGFFDVGENMEIGVDEGQIDHSEVKTIDDHDNMAVENMQIGVAEESVDHSEVKKIEDNAIVTVESMQTGVDEEQADRSEVKKVDDNAIVTVENMQIGVDEEQVDHSEVKKIEDNAIVTVENMQIGVDEEQVYHSEVKKNDNNTNVTVENRQIGFYDVGENMEICVDEGQIDHSEVKTIDDNDNVAVENMQIGVDEEQVDHSEVKKIEDNALVTVENMQVGVDEENVDHSDVKKIEDNAIVTVENMQIGVDEEQVDHSEVKKVDDNAVVTVENMQIGVDEEHVDQNEVKKIDDNANVTIEDILNDVHSSSFRDSDGRPVQVTDPTSEVETADLDAHKMVVKGIATIKNACTSGAKSESSQKISVSPASGEMIGSPTNLLNISVTPKDIGFSDGEENMRIGVNEEEVDHSQVKNTDENTDVAFEDILDEVRLSNFEDSDGIPAQFLPTEVRTSDLDVQEMVVTGTATKMAFASGRGVKFESLQKKNTSPASEKMSGSSTRLLNNPVTPRDIEFCDGEENMPIGVDEEQVDRSEVKKIDKNTMTVDSDVCDVKSASLQKISRGREDSEMKLAHEKVDAGTFYEEENMQKSGNREKNEDNQELHSAAPSEDEKVVEDISGSIMVMENVIPLHVFPRESSACSVQQVHNMDNDTNCVMDEATALCLDASTGEKITDENSNAIVEDILDEVHSSSFEDSNGTPVQVLPTYPSNAVETSELDVHEMVVTGTATTNADTSRVKFECSQKVNVSPVSEEVIGSSTKLTNDIVTPKEIGFIDVEKNMQIGVDEEQVDYNEMKKSDDNANVTAENIQIGFFDVEENMEISVYEGKVDHSEVKMIDDNDNVAVENMQVGVAEEHVDPSEVKKIDDNTNVTVENIQIGFFDVGENMEIGIDEGQVDHSVVKMIDDNVNVAVENMEIGVDEEQVDHSKVQKIEDKATVNVENMQIGVDEEHVNHNEVKKIDDNVKVTVENMQIGIFYLEETMEIGVDEEQVDHREVEKIDDNVNVAVENIEIGVAEDQIDHIEVKKIEDNAIVTAEDMQIGIDEEHVDHSEVKKIDDKDNVTVEDILNDVHSSSFGDSDRTPVQVLPTDPLSEEETSDLDVHPMAIDSSLIKCRSLPYSGIAAGHVDACEVKSAYSQKTSRASGEMIGSPANLLNISVTPNDIRFSDGEENVRTGVDEEEVDHSQVKKIDENISMTVEGDTENLDQISNHEGSIMKDANPLHVSPKESSGCSVEEVHKLDDNNCVVDAVAVMSDEQVHKSDDNNNCVVDDASAMCFEASRSAKNTYENNEVAFDDILDEVRLSNFEDSDGTPALFLPTDQSTKMETNDLDAQEIVAADTCEAMLKSSEKSCIAAVPDDCIGFSPNDVENCDVGGVGAEDENQPSETASRKRRDTNSDEEVKDELVPTSEMDSSNFSLHQLFASETASGDEDAYHKKLDSPSKATPMIHKENIKFDKEEVGSVMSIGVVAEKDSNEKTSVSAELDGVKSDHKFDNFQIEDNQDLSQATPSDLNVEADEGAGKDKLNVEVIDLNSNSGVDDVQMEGLDTVARNDSNVKTNLNVDTVAGNGSNEKTNLSDEHKLEEEPDQLSEVKSDHKVESGSVVGNADACEVSSASLQKTSHGQEVFKFKSQPEGDEEVKDELVPTSEMDSSNFCLHQLFASETASGDVDSYPKRLDSPSKATPMIHKENIRFDKKEEVGSVMSRNKFAKRQPLQDLKQN